MSRRHAIILSAALLSWAIIASILCASIVDEQRGRAGVELVAVETDAGWVWDSAVRP